MLGSKVCMTPMTKFNKGLRCRPTHQIGQEAARIFPQYRSVRLEERAAMRGGVLFISFSMSFIFLPSTSLIGKSRGQGLTVAVGTTVILFSMCSSLATTLPPEYPWEFTVVFMPRH